MPDEFVPKYYVECFYFSITINTRRDSDWPANSGTVLNCTVLSKIPQDYNEDSEWVGV